MPYQTKISITQVSYIQQQLLVFVILLMLIPLSSEVNAATLRIAVASNFLPACKEVANAFRHQTGYAVTISSASTGKLFAQIINGAPYDVFLAANEREPKRLEEKGFVNGDSRFTYAIGRLAIMTSQGTNNDQSLVSRLQHGDWQRLAIANPRTAPYGLAARQVLQHLAIWNTTKGKLIRGENIGQAFYFTRSGNAELGLVALSQIRLMPDKLSSSYEEIPPDWHQPLNQQAVILKRSEQQQEAEAFLSFLKEVHIKQLIKEKYGYAVINERLQR